jgi:hypothetical protein
MFGNIGSNLPILVQVTFKYALSMRDGYVVLQPERMQRGHEPVADYVVTGINIVVMACCQQVYCSGFTVDKQDPISTKLHFYSLTNLPRLVYKCLILMS